MAIHTHTHMHTHAHKHKPIQTTHKPVPTGAWCVEKTIALSLCPILYPKQRVITNTFEGFCIAEVNGVFFCSCYALPSWELERFHVMLDNLVAELDGHRLLAIAGEINAWSVECWSKRTNSRTDAVLESFARLRVALGNTRERQLLI